MARILVTGGSGMLGSYVALQAAKSGWETIATYSAHDVSIPGCTMVRLECRSADDVSRLLADTRPDAVVHTAALVRPDICEMRKRDAFSLNVLGTCNVLAASEAIGAHFVHVSTDLVFNGENNPSLEADPLSPVNYYGLTKAAAEAAVSASNTPTAIVRTSTLYGPRMFPHLESYSDKVIEGLRARQMVPAFIDQYRQNVPVWNVADVLLEIAERRMTGTFHAVCPDVTTRYQLAVRIADLFGLDARYVDAIPMSRANAIARRPKMLAIETANTARSLHTRLLSFDEGTAELIQRAETVP